MKEPIISSRNFILKYIYKWILKPLFFLSDPEKIHNLIVFFGKILGSNQITCFFTRLLFGYSNKALQQDILGINFKNPVGLSAGFDKNADLTQIINSVGFGFEEIGSITGEFCEGNPKPRLWRLKKSRSLAVNYGLKNLGCEKISQKLNGKKFNLPIWTSIAKTNCLETVETKKGIADYVKAYKFMSDIGDISVINLSCPNSYGGQPFNDPHQLNLLLSEINKVNSKKPIFLKISPDLSFKQLDNIIEVSKKHNVAGFVCTNLSKKYESLNILDKGIEYQGGISGKSIEGLSNEVIKYIYKKSKGRFIIVGVGGIFSANDAYKKIHSGASLVQLITGMIYQGPQAISEINQGLVKLLKRDKLKNISEAIGVDAIA